MKIILVITDSKRKNLVFISEFFKTLSLQDAINEVSLGKLEDIFVVNNKFGKYLRSAPNTLVKDNLDKLSVSPNEIIAYANHTKHFQSTDAISMYAAQYIASIIELDKPFLETVDGDRELVVRVKDKIISHGNLIIKSAKEFNIDPYLLGAIIIDEIVRMSLFEDISDVFWLDLIGRNVSVGIAQVTVETANNVIKGGVYNPNPEDKKLPFFGNLSKKDRQYLFQYVIQPKYNIHFSAAYIRDIIDFWSSKLDISNRPEILATLYAQGYGDPKIDPEANKRGSQIANEFYSLAQKWLK